MAKQSDQDAYACSGQKCSAQSIVFVHPEWSKAGFEAKIEALAAQRCLEDLTIGPVMTWTTEAVLAHVHQVCTIPGAKLLFGGAALDQDSIPEEYGAVQPTAVFVPLDQLLDEKWFGLCTTEVFGPFQIVTQWKDVSDVLECIHRMDHHLTAAIVSEDVSFRQLILGATTNGTTYVGMRARTTGAPTNHWFGPGGDVRGAGIGTPEAVLGQLHLS